MLPEAEHWTGIRTRGIGRTQTGRDKYGTENSDANPLYLLGEVVDEWLDVGNYLHWAIARLQTGPGGRQRIYIAGPYRAPTVEEVDANIRRARDAEAELFRRGHCPLCPHSNTARFERDYPDIPDDAYLTADLAWLIVSHSILMLPGWQDSSGASIEYEAACKLKLKVYYSLDEVPSLSIPSCTSPGPKCTKGPESTEGGE